MPVWAAQGSSQNSAPSLISQWLLQIPELSIWTRNMCNEVHQDLSVTPLSRVCFITLLARICYLLGQLVGFFFFFFSFLFLSLKILFVVHFYFFNLSKEWYLMGMKSSLTEFNRKLFSVKPKNSPHYGWGFMILQLKIYLLYIDYLILTVDCDS